VVFSESGEEVRVCSESDEECGCHLQLPCREEGELFRCFGDDGQDFELLQRAVDDGEVGVAPPHRLRRAVRKH
jgi:hypothetical protein